MLGPKALCSELPGHSLNIRGITLANARDMAEQYESCKIYGFEVRTLSESKQPAILYWSVCVHCTIHFCTGNSPLVNTRPKLRLSGALGRASRWAVSLLSRLLLRSKNPESQQPRFNLLLYASRIFDAKPSAKKLFKAQVMDSCSMRFLLDGDVAVQLTKVSLSNEIANASKRRIIALSETVVHWLS